MRLPILGRTYRYRYGYPWRWAILAEVAWRIEHGPLVRRAYGWRKAAERAGHAAASRTGESTP